MERILMSGALNGFLKVHLLKCNFLIRHHRLHLFATLINQDTWRWDEELVDVLFSDEDRDIIKGIPLSIHSARDVMIWNNGSTGKLTVCDAY